MPWWTNRQLRSSDKNARKQAVRKLSLSRDSEAVHLLVEALKDEDEDVRKLAAVGLGKVSRASTVIPLLSIFKDEDERDDIRAEVKQSILAIGSEAVQPLATALKNRDKHMKMAAAELLADIGDEKAVQPLTETLKDEERDVRKAAAVALGKISRGGAVAALLTAFGDDERKEEIKEAVRESMLAIGFEAVQPMTMILVSGTPDVRELAEELLIELGAVDRVMETLVETVSNARLRPDMRKATAGVLIKIGSKAVQPLLDVVRDRNRDADALRYVLMALVGIGDMAAFEPLAILAQRVEPDTEMHKSLKKALSSIGSANPQILIELIITGGGCEPSNVPLVKSEAARVLAEVGGRASTQALAKALEDESSMVRSAARNALDSIGYAGESGGGTVDTRSLSAWKDEIQHIRDVLERIRIDHHQKNLRLEELRHQYGELLVDISLGIRDPDERDEIRQDLRDLEEEVSDLELTLKGLHQRERLNVNAARGPEFVSEQGT